MLTVKIQPSMWGIESNFIQLHIEVTSPRLPEGKLNYFTEIYRGEFESLFDLQWQKAYETIKQYLNKNLDTPETGAEQCDH